MHCFYINKCALIAAAWMSGFISAAMCGDVPASTPAIINLPPATSVTSTGYLFTVNKHHLYTYVLKQTTSFMSAGDELNYITTLTWKFALTPTVVSENQAQLAITIVRVQATHDGPGSRRQVDSGLPIEQDGHEDPLLGHLIAFAGAELIVTLNPNTGNVSSVTGGDAVVTRINKMVPGAFPGDPPPLDGAAKAAFSNEALTRMWQQLLSLPTNEPVVVPLGPPLQGALERRWQESNWIDALPMGTDRLQASILPDPTPVAVTVNQVAGSGSRSITDGVPGPGNGKLSFELVFQALTQPVIQRHSVLWELTPLPLR